MKLKSDKFTFIDLFSGIGGFKIALSNQGGISLGYSEVNKDAIETYCENFNEKIENNFGDIKKIKTLPTSDILTAGVPCQSWSIAGKNLGFDDDRGQLWNDTIYLLKQSQPKTFIFENVKGLADPRNKDALNYIMVRIKEAGYYADYYVVNSFDYGVPQNRVRVYIVGFRDEKYFKKFEIPDALQQKSILRDILDLKIESTNNLSLIQQNLFGNKIGKNMSLSNKNGYNDYFLFNDLRNGHTTIHTWDILDTTYKQKSICNLLLKNRRKSLYGKLDGNPLSFEHFKALDNSIMLSEIKELISLDILKEIEYRFLIIKRDLNEVSKEEEELLKYSDNKQFSIDELKTNRNIKLDRISISKMIKTLNDKNIIKCIEIRYDFKNTKISTGLFGVNRIFLPSSDIYPTLVASDSNDYVALKDIQHSKTYKEDFLNEIYKKGNYRKITRSEACLIQGFSKNFKLPKSRTRWMKLIGNSVSIPVVEMICCSMLKTGFMHKEKDKCHKIDVIEASFSKYDGFDELDV